MSAAAKFTPGPWRVVDDFRVDAGTYHVALCINAPGAGTAEGNAQLIAAAPEMLAALAMARYELQTLVPRITNPYRKSAQSVIDEIDKATAKAQS